MGVERFRQDEGGYADWLAVHPNGFIFNNFGGPHRGFNVLHRAGCSFLGRQRDEGRRTRYQKVCGDEIADLISVMAQLRAVTEGWKESGKCKPWSVADASREPKRHPDSTGATLQSAETVKIVQSAPRRRPSFAPAPAPDDFVLWRPADEVAAVEVEPLLASWEAKSHPSQRRVQAYLDEVEATLAVRLKEYGVRFYLRVDVVRQEATNLLRHYDLENYLTPLAQRLRNPAIVLAMAEKRYPRTASDRSRITLGRVQAGAPLEGWTPHVESRVATELIAAGVQPAAQGPLEVVIAWRCDPSRRAWWNLWKPTGDALGPLLGEPFPANPFNPADDRLVRLDMHHCPAMGPNNVTEVSLWWRPTKVP